MIEEPFRFVEAIANRREYIESQLATGSPIVALDYADGVLLFTVGRERQKLFEIYDRIALGAIGHPGDIERLRMTAIELASTEGFTRSAGDVSLRRMANYSLSPALKAAFEQVYGPPYLARLLFIELGAAPGQNTFLRVDYDGAIQSNGTSFSPSRLSYAVLSGTRPSTEAMETMLARRGNARASLQEALRVALEAWSLGFCMLDEEKVPENLPNPEQLRETAKTQLAQASIEAAVLEAHARSHATYRVLTDPELQPLLSQLTAADKNA